MRRRSCGPGLLNWRLPTQIVHGTADTYNDPAASADFGAEIASGDSAMHLVEGAHHELLDDERADEVLDAARLPAGGQHGWQTG